MLAHPVNINFNKIGKCTCKNKLLHFFLNMLTVETTETSVVSMLLAEAGGITFISSDEVHYT